VRQAVAIAKQFPGTPIKMIWSREEDMAHDFFRRSRNARRLPASMRTTSWSAFTCACRDSRSTRSTTRSRSVDGKDDRQMQGYTDKPGDAQLGYTFPALLLEYSMRNTHVPVGPWRGVNTNQNGFYMECFIDEVAKAAGAIRSSSAVR
jgi:isoquinoline 1-oxidoreductase beta subunit